MKKSIPLALLFVLLFSCSETYDEKLFMGKWKTTSWIEKDSGKKINNKMDFTFNADKTYEIDYGSLKEAGTYYISGGFLHTTETDNAEKKVKLVKVVSDTIIFDMNRTGRIESVVLVKS